MVNPVRVLRLGGWIVAGLLGLPAVLLSRDTPLKPTGIQVRGVVGVASSLLFRDLVIEEGTSPWGSFAVSGHGVSLSGWASVDSDDQQTVSELFLAYSHKLPVVDLHVGVTQVLVPSIREVDPVAGRVALSSNNSTRVVADLSFDRFFRRPESLVSGSITVALLRREHWLLDARAGASSWDRRGDNLEGWSARLIAAFRPTNGPRLTAYLGYASTNTDTSPPLLVDDGLVSGVSLGFR